MKYEEKIVPTTATIFISDFSKHRPLLELSKEAIFEEQIKDNGESLNSNVRANYVTSYFAHQNNEKFIPLIDLVLETANDIINSSEKDGIKMEFQCINSWGMEYFSGDYAIPHRHSYWVLCYSAICYIDVEDDCAPVIFENHTVVQPKSNMFLLFPGSLVHHVPKTNSKRILMSYNLL
jgi:hypothetical protein